MKHRLSSVLLAFILSLCAAASACAAETEESGSAFDALSHDLIASSASNVGGFMDVDASAWYAEAVHHVSERGLMVGTGNNSFSPDATFTRAQAATVLYRMAGEPEVSGADNFTDTDAGQWYSDAVLWCSSKGIVEGYGDGLFGTTDPVTQEQLLTLFHRYIGAPASDGPDHVEVSDYAQNAVRWALSAGIASENAGYAFSPRSAATRGTVALMLANLERLQEAETDVKMTGTLQLKVNDASLTVLWEDNESVEALKELVREEPLIIPMSMYGGFEQVGSLETSLPRNDVQTTTGAGDIVLYSGSNIVMFYGSNSWGYTRLGRITALSDEELRELLGNDDVTVTLALVY